MGVGYGLKCIVIISIPLALIFMAYSHLNYTHVYGEREISEIVSTKHVEHSLQQLTTKSVTSVIKKVKCSPVRKIVFLKTHKTAGSSVYLVLNQHLKRYGTTNKQRFFPSPFIGGYPGHFNSRFVISKDLKSIGSERTKPDVVAGHFRFNKTALEKFMPEGTRYITILRNPEDAFYSSFFYYYGAQRYFNVDSKGATCNYSPYLDILGKSNATFSEYLRIAPARLNPKVPWYFRSLNYQAHDLGLDPTRTDQEYISQQIRLLSSSFHLVMIAEYFSESLVLLREELCMGWSYLSGDVRNKGKYKKHNLTMQERGVIRHLNKLDYAIYSHFNRTLWRRIDAYGRERMAEDVKKIHRTQTDEQQDFGETSEVKKENFVEDVSRHYKPDGSARLAERLVKNTAFSTKDDEIREMAKYMISNSGGCNL